jgi:hypothetical protein
MKIRIALASVIIFGLVIICVAQSGRETAGQQTARDSDKPFSRDEILEMLKKVGPRQLSQGDIAAEIDRRGINFIADEKTLEELRHAGARSFVVIAVQHASDDVAGPHLRTPGDAGEEPISEAAEKAKLEAEVARMPFLEQARHWAMEFANQLPDFVVTQIVRRDARGPNTRSWIHQDTLEVELTYRVERGEELKLVRMNGAPTTQRYDDLDGSTSTGEWGAMMPNLFRPESRAEFKEVRHETFNGHPTVLYDFSVERANSSNMITEKKSGRSIRAGYTGSMWVDADTKRVLRIEQSAIEIPRDFPISMAEDAVEYDWITISGERYFLPTHAEVILGHESERFYTRNMIEFKNYHKFEGTIRVVPN